MDSSGEIIEVWTKEQLMGAPKEDDGGKKGKKDLDVLLLWGQPGHLTDAEADCYVSSVYDGSYPSLLGHCGCLEKFLEC